MGPCADVRVRNLLPRTTPRGPGQEACSLPGGESDKELSCLDPPARTTRSWPASLFLAGGGIRRRLLVVFAPRTAAASANGLARAVPEWPRTRTRWLWIGGLGGI